MSEVKARIMDEQAINRALIRISHEIIEKEQGSRRFSRCRNKA